MVCRNELVIYIIIYLFSIGCCLAETPEEFSNPTWILSQQYDSSGEIILSLLNGTTLCLESRFPEYLIGTTVQQWGFNLISANLSHFSGPSVLLFCPYFWDKYYLFSASFIVKENLAIIGFKCTLAQLNPQFESQIPPAGGREVKHSKPVYNCFGRRPWYSNDLTLLGK